MLLHSLRRFFGRGWRPTSRARAVHSRDQRESKGLHPVLSAFLAPLVFVFIFSCLILGNPGIGPYELDLINRRARYEACRADLKALRLESLSEVKKIRVDLFHAYASRHGDQKAARGRRIDEHRVQPSSTILGGVQTDNLATVASLEIRIFELRELMRSCESLISFFETEEHKLMALEELIRTRWIKFGHPYERHPPGSDSPALRGHQLYAKFKALLASARLLGIAMESLRSEAVQERSVFP
jgi:hypothetical protein